MIRLLCLCLVALLLQGCGQADAIQGIQRAMPGAKVCTYREYRQLAKYQFIVYYSNSVYLVHCYGAFNPADYVKTIPLDMQELKP